MRLLVTHFALILFLSPVIQNTYGDNVKSMQSALVFFNLHAQSTICYIFGDPKGLIILPTAGGSWQISGFQMR